MVKIGCRINNTHLMSIKAGISEREDEVKDIVP